MEIPVAVFVRGSNSTARRSTKTPAADVRIERIAGGARSYAASGTAERRGPAISPVHTLVSARDHRAVRDVGQRMGIGFERIGWAFGGAKGLISSPGHLGQIGRLRRPGVRLPGTRNAHRLCWIATWAKPLFDRENSRRTRGRRLGKNAVSPPTNRRASGVWPALVGKQGRSVRVVLVEFPGRRRPWPSTWGAVILF